jgi:hypothetical protein
MSLHCDLITCSKSLPEPIRDRLMYERLMESDMAKILYAEKEARKYRNENKTDHN